MGLVANCRFQDNFSGDTAVPGDTALYNLPITKFYVSLQREQTAMSFEFISTATSVARQQQLWGMIIGVAGLLIFGFAVFKGKPMAMTLIGVALAAVGAWFLYQSHQLGRVQGEWTIRADEQTLSWQSPVESLDPSFSVALGDIEYVDRSAEQTRGNDRPVYHLIMNDDTAIKLRDISGVNLTELAAYLSNRGIETRVSERFNLPMELRNK